MSSVARKLLQVQPSATGDASDDDFANVVLLLDGDGTSGDANNTFTDSSTNGYTVTENGSVAQGSFSPYGDNWSVYFDGSSYLNTASGATALGTGAFTVEFWINTTDTSFNIMNPDSSTGNGFWGLMVQSGDLRWNNQYNLTNLWIVDGAPILDGQWHHVAIVSSSSVFKVFYDGVSQSIQSGSFTDSYNYPYSDGLRIGSGNLATFKGYLSNIRLVSGTAIYSSDFDAPTEPFTNSTSYTEKLLACQSNRFIDNGNSSYSITTSGSPKVTPFSPFKDDDARDITTDGGSAYFDGVKTTQLYAGTSNVIPATADFTIEGWVYFTGVNTSNNRSVFFVKDSGTAVSGNRSFQAILNNNGTKYDDLTIVLFQTNSNYDVSTFTHTFEFNEWYHIAVTRTGQTLECFINGTSIGTDTNAKTSINQTTEENYIGSWNSSNKDDTHVGYFSDFRIIHARIYTSNFTPPTEPLSATAGSAYTINTLSYESKEYAHGNDSNPQGVAFKSDGTKMYIIGATNDSVFQYSLSTAWDITTASYDSVSLSVSSEDTIPTGLAFSPDGTKMYISGNANDKIFQYTLSTAWDLSTASYASKSLSLNNTSVGDLFIHPSGTSIYDIDNSGDVVNQYDMTTAFDVSTASYTQQFSVSTQETIPVGLAFSSNGTKMFVAGQSGDDINQYTLSTAWDVTTASFDNITFATNSQSVNPAGLAFKDDGTKLYMISNTADKVFQYSTTPDSELLLNFHDAGIYDKTGLNNLDTVADAQIDTAVKKYGTGSIEFDGTGDYLEAFYPSGLYDGFDDMDWTIEAWVYPKADSDDRGGIVELYTSDTHYIRLMYLPGSTSGNVDFQFSGNGFDIQTGNNSELAWYHVAGVSYNGTLTLYVNGTSIGSDSGYNLASVADPRVLIGLDLVNVDRYTDGYIDDVRITKGVARYTSNFTPPTAALPKF